MKERAKTDEEIVAEMKAKLKGATSVPIFNSAQEKDKWWFNRVGLDIERLKKGVMSGAAELRASLPLEKVHLMDKCRGDVDAMHLFEADIKKRAKALSKQGTGAMEYGSQAIIERNKKVQIENFRN